MATLTSAYSPDYSKKASVLTGNPNRVTVIVEGDDDVAFWKDILTEQCKEKDFHVNPYQRMAERFTPEGANGKSYIMKQSQLFNENHIGCVDSDLDWILQEYTDYGRIISYNKYLLQTYVYSVENIFCYPASLRLLCMTATDEIVEYDFDKYVKKLSILIYPLLVWALYIRSSGKQGITRVEWRSLLIDIDTTFDDALSVIEDKVKYKLTEIQSANIGMVEGMALFENKLKEEKRLTKESSYLFIVGHELQDHLYNSIMKPLYDKYKNLHIDKLKNELYGKPQLGVELNIYAKKKSIGKITPINEGYKNSHFYRMICSDIVSVWQ